MTTTKDLLTQYNETCATYQAAQDDHHGGEVVSDYERYEDSLMTLVHEMASRLALFNEHAATLNRALDDAYYYRVDENDLSDPDDIESMDQGDIEKARAYETTRDALFPDVFNQQLTIDDLEA